MLADLDDTASGESDDASEREVEAGRNRKPRKLYARRDKLVNELADV